MDGVKVETGSNGEGKGGEMSGFWFGESSALSSLLVNYHVPDYLPALKCK